MTGIYKITCIPINKSYIGQSVSIKRRWSAHKTALKHNIHNNYKLQEAYNLYGENSFSFEILELCPAKTLNEKEKEYIKKYNTYYEGFNLTEGGELCLIGEKNPMYGKIGTESPRYVDNIYQLSLAGSIIAEYESANLAALKVSGQAGHIINCLQSWKNHKSSAKDIASRERFTHKGFYWIYKKDYEILYQIGYDFSQKRNKKSLTISDLGDKGTLKGDL